MESQALELCQQYYQDFHGVGDIAMIKNTFVAAGGQGQVFKCECTQGLDISSIDYAAQSMPGHLEGLRENGFIPKTVKNEILRG